MAPKARAGAAKAGAAKAKAKAGASSALRAGASLALGSKSSAASTPVTSPSNGTPSKPKKLSEPLDAKSPLAAAAESSLNATEAVVDEATLAAAAEEASARKAAEEAAAKEAAKEAERRAALAEGEVTVKYNMYAEKFRISKHQLRAEDIDELYCLSDVMPGCFIHLSRREFAYGEEHEYIVEDPPGTFQGLMAGETYWCYVQQDAEQEKKDQERMRKLREEEKRKLDDGKPKYERDGAFAGVAESCSCIFGNPCIEEHTCKDWYNRFAVATKNGWKGF